MGSSKGQSAKKPSKKKKSKGDEALKPPVSGAAEVSEEEFDEAQASSSTSKTSPPHGNGITGDVTVGEDVPNSPQLLEDMPEPDSAKPKSVTFADLFKGNRDPEQGMILKQYEVGEGVLDIPDEMIKPIEDIWGYCLVWCFTGRFPGLKAVDAIVQSWNVPCRIIPHCKGWVVLKFENDKDRYELLRKDISKAYGKEFRLKIPSHGFVFDFAEFTTLPVWVQLHNVPMQMWSDGCIGMLASKVGKPLRTNLVTKQLGKVGFCRALVGFSKEPVTKFKVACMGKKYTQVVEFEEEPKYYFHCKTWNHGPFSCRSLELKKLKEQIDLNKAGAHTVKDTVLQAEGVQNTDKPNEWVTKGRQNKGFTEPPDGHITSPSYTTKDNAPRGGKGVLTLVPNTLGKKPGTADGVGRKKSDVGEALVGKKAGHKKGRKGSDPPP
ncbi:unnamed protein product [Cuscuta campestris]|uniref:Uncharacterized protein n=1 Tax=Cuscuta campestris TaxID=132261 RepID=A0A484KYX5_9ASTE|nr:unnamed protein product [Cuscuta campestris]